MRGRSPRAGRPPRRERLWRALSDPGCCRSSIPVRLYSATEQCRRRCTSSGRIPGTASPLAGRAGIELHDVAGGRADDYVTFDEAQRFIVEIKREKADASRQSIETAYLTQTFEYQRTNVPLGMLLVLDQTSHKHGLPHLKDTIWVVHRDPPGNGTRRSAVVGVVAGNRPVPSAMKSIQKDAYRAAARSRLADDRGGEQRRGQPANAVRSAVEIHTIAARYGIWRRCRRRRRRSCRLPRPVRSEGVSLDRAKPVEPAREELAYRPGWRYSSSPGSVRHLRSRTSWPIITPCRARPPCRATTCSTHACSHWVTSAR